MLLHLTPNTLFLVSALQIPQVGDGDDYVRCRCHRARLRWKDPAPKNLRRSSCLEFDVNVGLQGAMKGVLPRARAGWRGSSPPCRLSSSVANKSGFTYETEVFPPALSDEEIKGKRSSPLKKASFQPSSVLFPTTRTGKSMVAFHSLTSYPKARCTHFNLS
jgi:hypothetical protein